ncbi:MAG: hypothetical protein ACTSO9_21185 [Candidatus Helarchaeota archaeon]
MKVEINNLIKKIDHLIPIYAQKFHISEDGSKLFLELAIIQSLKENPSLGLVYNENGFIEGEDSNLQEFIKEIENWDEEEFELEDFEVIGYCKNIR